MKNFLLILLSLMATVSTFAQEDTVISVAETITLPL